MAQNNIESYVTVEARSETWINDQTNENQNLMKYRSTLFLHTHTVLGKSHPLRFPRLLILFANSILCNKCRMETEIRFEWFFEITFFIGCILINCFCFFFFALYFSLSPLMPHMIRKYSQLFNYEQKFGC